MFRSVFYIKNRTMYDPTVTYDLRDMDYLDLMVYYHMKLALVKHCTEFHEIGYCSASINYHAKD